MPTLSLRPMRGRDPSEAHRASSPLELFFDLTVVVAVSFAASGSAHALEEGRPAHASASYLLVFFALWWAWLNFTWFASAYDTDDWLFRVVTVAQMGGALTVAAGVPRVYEHDDLAVVVAGYVIMRAAMVFQWLRVARNAPGYRRTACTYAAGIAVVQVFWVVVLWLPDAARVPVVMVLVVGELSVPILAERRSMTPFHPGHVTERYGLFTIIVLGEGVLADGNSVIEALQGGEHLAELVTLAIGGLMVLAAMWWIYFADDSTLVAGGFGRTLTWGYGHYVVFASAAAVSTGVEVQVAVITGHAHVGELAARLVVGVPVALYVAAVWVLVVRGDAVRGVDVAVLAAAVLVVLAAFLPLPPAAFTAVVAGVLVAAVAFLVAIGGTDGRRGTPADDAKGTQTADAAGEPA